MAVKGTFGIQKSPMLHPLGQIISCKAQINPGGLQKRSSRANALEECVVDRLLTDRPF